MKRALVPRLVSKGFALGVLVTLACSPRACDKSKEVPVYKHVPSPNLTFTRSDPPSSQCPHASSTRAGRVAVAPHPLSGLTAVGSIHDGPWADRPARFLDLPEGTAHLAIERPLGDAGGYDVRAPSGALAFTRETTSSGAHVLARAEHYYADAAWHPWAGAGKETRAAGYLNYGGELLACAFRGDEGQTLVTSPNGQTPDKPIRPDYTSVTLERPFEASVMRQLVWTYTVNEPAVGAIDGAGYSVIALASGRFVVLLTTGDDQDRGTLGTDAPIEEGATDLAIVPPYALVVYGGGDAGALAARRGAARVTRLDARRPDGSLAWRTELPFLAAQPPIDGAGRVYVVGAGISALDMDGRPLWSSPSAVTLRAQAFADGTLALVRGAELQIVASDGAIRQSLRAPEEITSYPAIASDGSVWVASAKTLYVAR